MRHLRRTPPFCRADGNIVADSIGEIAYRRLGGLDKGSARQASFRHFNAGLEKSFTAIYWDQRGAVKSFDDKTWRPDERAGRRARSHA